MTQPARKPGEGSKLAESLSVDDPSIPVLTERLTLPPLDLDLEFRLPERPGRATDRAPVLPETPVSLPADPDETRIAPLDTDATRPPVEARRTIAPLQIEEAALPQVPPGVARASPVVLEGPVTRSGPTTVAPAVEAEDIAPRVPTSLLVSNLNAMLSAPAPTHRRPQQDDFDLTVTDGGMRVNELDTELRERILLDLARRLPTEVDTIVRRHLETAIEEAIHRFAAEVRIALAGSLREIVDRAVKAELDRLKVPRS